MRKNFISSSICSSVSLAIHRRLRSLSAIWVFHFLHQDLSCPTQSVSLLSILLSLYLCCSLLLYLPLLSSVFSREVWHKKFWLRQLKWVLVLDVLDGILTVATFRAPVIWATGSFMTHAPALLLNALIWFINGTYSFWPWAVQVQGLYGYANWTHAGFWSGD